MGSSRIHRVRSRSAEDRLMISSRSASDALTGMWRKEKCAVSMPPSQDWAQLHCWSFLDTKRCDGGHESELELGERGLVGGRAQVRPHEVAPLARGIRGGAKPVAERALPRHGGHVDAAAGHVELPAVVHAAQATRLVAAEVQVGAAMGTARIEQPHPSSLSRNATRSSPMILTRTGGPSRSGSSCESSTGIQKRRKKSPIGVPGPVRVRSSLSSALSMVRALY